MAGRRRGRGRLPSYILALCWLGLTHAALAEEPLRVVLLFGATDVGIWSQRFSDALFGHPGIRDGAPPVSVSVEYLGLYNATPDGLDKVKQMLAWKQSIDPTDVVVAVQGVAGRFLADHAQDIYPGVPRLFVLPGREVAEEVAGTPDTHLLRSAITDAIPETVTLMDAMLPRLEEVLVITGAGALDAVYADYARTTLAGHPAAGKVRFLEGLALDELRERLRAAPRHAAALLLTYEGDPAGNVYRTADVTPELVAASAAPVFIAYDSLLGLGPVGGVLSSTERYGERTAALALDIIGGAGSRPAAPLPAMRTAFDAVALDNAGVPRASLPRDSEVLNDETPAYLAFVREILLALGVILLQLLLIVALWRLLRQRKRAATALTRQARDLERQKVLFESVINSIPDAIVITGVDARIAATNRQGFAVTFGYPPDTVLGRDCGVLTCGSELLELEQALLSGKALLEFQGEAGRRFPGEWTGTKILTEAGEHLGFVLVVRDVTERLAHEDERRQAHKMEALGSLAGGIAHDFNNILTVMLGNAELIQAGAGEVDESVAQIVRAGQRARELVGQILAFSRKGRAADLGPVDVRNLVEESVGFVRAALPAGIAVRVHVADDLQAGVNGNASQLQQVLLNLASNARDAMRDGGGTLSLRVYERTLPRGTIVSHGILRRGHYVCIEVADTGTGMSADLLQRVFDPFFTTKGPGEGTGMGLALVYGIVQAHEGAIHVKSRPGSGTRFEILLPAQPAGSLPASEHAAEMMCGRGERILLAEDDAGVRHMVEGMLQRLGYAVEAYADPRAALTAFAAAPQQYALVLSDRTMPGMDGLALCRAVRRLDATVPLLLCSGYSHVVEADAHALLEPVEFLGKPYRAAELTGLLQGLLDRSAERPRPAPGTGAAARHSLRL